ncbi:hypothetical protein JL722_5312 [Aureococcus anophagefferens]|nr:hypothetical protein JL722_5312 [Aureococcus anophagefferens]
MGVSPSSKGGVGKREVRGGAPADASIDAPAPDGAGARRGEDVFIGTLLSFLGPDLSSKDLMDAVGALRDLRNLGLVDRRYSRHCLAALAAVGRACVDRSTTELRVATGGHRSEATLLYRATLLSGARDYALTKAKDASGRLLVVLGDESCRPCQRCAVLGLKALLAAGYELSPKQLALAGEILGRRPNFRRGLLGGVTTTDARHRLVVHRDFRSGVFVCVFVDLVWLLHHLFYGKAKRPALEGFDDVLWVLRLGLKAPAAGPRQRLALEALFSLAAEPPSSPDGSKRAARGAFATLGVTATLVDTVAREKDATLRALAVDALAELCDDDDDAAAAVAVAGALLRRGLAAVDDGGALVCAADLGPPRGARGPRGGRAPGLHALVLVVSERCGEKPGAAPYTKELNAQAQRLVDEVTVATSGERRSDRESWARLERCGALEALLRLVAPEIFFAWVDAGADFEAHFKLLMSATIVFQDYTACLGARADLAAPPDLSAHVAALADACAEVVDLDTKETFQRGKGAQLCGHWALCAKALLRALGRAVFAEGPLGDFALQTLCLVGVCDDGNDSPNRFFDPFDAPGLVAMLKRKDAASEDLALDIKQRLGFSDEALVDLEADGDAIELRDVACLLIAHQVHEWDEASDGYKRRPHTTEWLRQLKGSVDVLLDLVKSQRRATHHAARELLGTMGGEDDLVAAVTEVVCADALEVVRKEAPHLGPGVTTHGAIEVFKATIGPHFIQSRLDALADESREKRDRLRRRKLLLLSEKAQELSKAAAAAKAADAEKAEAELLALLDEEEEKEAKKKKKKKKKKKDEPEAPPPPPPGAWVQAARAEPEKTESSSDSSDDDVAALLPSGSPPKTSKRARARERAREKKAVEETPAAEAPAAGGKKKKAAEEKPAPAAAAAPKADELAELLTKLDLKQHARHLRRQGVDFARAKVMSASDFVARGFTPKEATALVSAFVGNNVPKDGTAVTYNRGMFNHQPVARNVVPTPKEPKKKPEKKDEKRKDEKKKPAAKEPAKKPEDHDPNRPSTDDPVLDLGAVGRRPPPGAWQRPRRPRRPQHVLSGRPAHVL